MAYSTYFDNAATSFPKPGEVSRQMTRYLDEMGGAYGRSAYQRALEVSGIVEETRDRLAEQLGVRDSSKVVFTMNATHGINIVLRGLQLENRHVLVSPLEHNAASRPLHCLKEEKRVSVSVLPHFSDGFVDVARIKHHLQQDTALVIVNHQSNVNGVIQPLPAIKKEIGGIPILVDAAQSAGRIPLEVDRWGIDYLAITGHKGLLGPTGVGGLFLKKPDEIPPFIYGGTGSNSEDCAMPPFMPDKFEAGTHNIAGICGLLGALDARPDPGHTFEDFIVLIQEIKALKNLKFYGARERDHQGTVFSINHTTRDCASVGQELFDRFRIEIRVGLHCAPEAHKTIGTFPRGTVRIAPSVYHTVSDFEYLLKALAEIDRE